MGDKSKIEWTDATWTPIRARKTVVTGDRRTTTFVGWHCAHVSEACRNCYSEGINRRLGTGLDFKAQNRDKVEIFLDEKMLIAPLRWKKPRMIFVCSMTDLFADFVPDEFIDRMFAVMALCPQHTFQILTKRPERMREYFARPHPAPNLIGEWQERVCQAIDDLVPMRTDRSRAAKERVIAGPLPNVWLGTSCEDQPAADARIPHLLTTPAAIRFLSIEPMLGPIDLTNIPWPACERFPLTDNIADDFDALRLTGPNHSHIDWVICGGESGSNARPMHPDWARSLRDQCARAASPRNRIDGAQSAPGGVPFFFKQWGEWLHETQLAVKTVSYEQVQRTRLHQWPDETASMRVGKKAAGRLLDGVEHNGFPPISDNPVNPPALTLANHGA